MGVFLAYLLTKAMCLKLEWKYLFYAILIYIYLTFNLLFFLNIIEILFIFWDFFGSWKHCSLRWGMSCTHQMTLKCTDTVYCERLSVCISTKYFLTVMGVRCDTSSFAMSRHKEMTKLEDVATCWTNVRSLGWKWHCAFFIYFPLCYCMSEHTMQFGFTLT